MATTDLVKAPTTELGLGNPGGLPSWTGLGHTMFGGRTDATIFVDDRETLPELRWPVSVRTTYPRMSRDSQLKALERGTLLPITRYAWGIDDNGAPEAMVNQACADWNLPLIDDAIAERETGRPLNPVGRQKGRFSFSRHQEEALKTIRPGAEFFEQVGFIGDDGLWHPSKLGQLPPRSIEQILIASDGGLVAVKQNGFNEDGTQRKPLEVGRLVVYVWDRDDRSDWIGTSMYEACYREWLLKDRLLRIDLINHERAGGYAIGKAAPGATKGDVQKLDRMMQSLASGERSGGAVPDGTEIKTFGTSGSDRIASINRHDEAMARSWLLMSIQLGSTQTGARAVGDVHQELWGYSQEAIAIWFRDVFNEHALEDWADWNYGAPEFVPRLVFIKPKAQPDAATQLGAAGATLDPVTAAALSGATPRQVGRIRAAYDRDNREYRARLQQVLPYLLSEEELEYVGDLAEADEQVQEELQLALSEGLVRPTRAKPAPRAASALPLPERKLRREPTEIEVRAAVDFAAMETNWVSAVDQLVTAWKTIRTQQVAELHDAIVAADGDLTVLSTLEATAAGGDVIAAQLTQMAHTGAAEAVAEASRQGVPASLPDMETLAAELEARAAALEQLLTRSLSGAAATKAVQLTGPALTADQVASQVTDYLSGLGDTYLQDQLGGGLSAAATSGRLAAMQTNEASRYYISALLDQAVCQPCADDDGREFATAEAIAEVMPAGGNASCLGGPRCRCSAIAVYDEAAPSA